MSKQNLSLGSVFLKLGIISVALAAVVATTNSLMLYMGGGTLGASAPATMTASISGWFLTVVMFSIVQMFILGIATFMFAIGFTFAEKIYNDLNADQRLTVWKLVKWALIADLGLSLLIAIYSGSAQYAIFSALHADPTINLVTSILAGLVTVIYCVPVFAFIGTVATIIFGTVAAVVFGGMKNRNQTTDSPKDSNSFDK